MKAPRKEGKKMTQNGVKKLYKKEPSQKTLASHHNARFLYFSLAVVAAIAITFLAVRQFKKDEVSDYPQLTVLKKHIFGDDVINGTVAQKLRGHTIKDDFYVVFISVSNAKERARVFIGTANNLAEAWDAAERETTVFMEKNAYNLMWAKADIVNSMERIPTTRLNNYVVSTTFQNFFRKGIALDDNFDTAFLEAEISGNKLLNYYTERQLAAENVNYEANLLHLKNINFYLSRWLGKKEVSKIPDEIIIFTTEGFFCDENVQVYELYNEGMATGRRRDMVDRDYLEPIVLSASEYLYDMILADGQFIYGYYPVFDNWMTSYNILRHAGSLWSLINLYRMTENESIVEGIDSAVEYLLDNIVDKNPDTVFLVEYKADEIKLGGNALAIIALTEYMNVFGTEQYIPLVEQLANGILELQNPNTGKFYHVLNYPSFTEKEAYRTVYYDGEAAFALARAYTYTGLEKFLEGAQLSVEYFILNDYTRYRDHWVAYSLHEVTKYIPDPRYFEFALKNVEKNLDRISDQTTSFHTYLELLAISWQTYERILKSGVRVEYLEGFDVRYFAETIYKRAAYMLNSFFFPEYAMYMKIPENALGSFFVRHDSFRIRIDDNQHFIGGYYYYLVNHDSIHSHISDGFIRQINAGNYQRSAIPLQAGENDEEE